MHGQQPWQPCYGRYSCGCGPFHLILYMFIFSKPKKTQLSSDWTAFPDGSRCTDEKPALFPFQNSQKHNDRCHIATGKRLMDVGISVLKRVELNRDGSGVTNTCTASRVGKRGYSLWTRGRYDRCCTHTADRRRDCRCCIHTAD